MSATVSKSALKARMLEIFREVEASGEELVVTSHGRPVLRVVPFRACAKVEEVFADVRGRVALPSDEDLCTPLPAEAFADSDLEELVS
jgi:prevent-host-death family protein